MLLEAKNLDFAYGRHPVLSGVSIELTAGEVLALLGPNGSGKSTLLRVLLGQLGASGSICWDGRQIGQWTRRELARTVGYLPQTPAADPEQRVAEVLQTGRAPYWGAFGIESPRDLEVVHQVAGQLGLAEFLDRPIAELSGGQQQRVYIGRCLVQEPKALLLDEPSTFLDLRHQVELTRLMRSLSRQQGIGVLLASHDLNLAATCADRLVLLHEGKVVANGPPSAVVEPQLLSRVYGVPMRQVETASGRVPLVYPDLAS